MWQLVAKSDISIVNASVAVLHQLSNSHRRVTSEISLEEGLGLLVL